MKTLIELYKKPNNIVSFEKLKKEIKNVGYRYNMQCFCDKIYITINPVEKGKKVYISTLVMKELVELDSALNLYYQKAVVQISNNVIYFYISM